ncbi:1258_t:CDS:2 [Acaulospora colombiana]|uniref:1258_t:CDS:1 n=1 Tax=Acaulospora colombiana TaxID=27376 RepID=A0ACA9K8D9_9GLOM|nr:1258_t:CDS:2 [Acaulospora colombiana]
MAAKSSRFAELLNSFEQNSDASKPTPLPKPQVPINKKPPPLPPRENFISSQPNSSTEISAREKNQGIKAKSRYLDVDEFQDDSYEPKPSRINRNNASGLTRLVNITAEDQEGDNIGSKFTRTNVKNVHNKMAGKYAKEEDQEGNDDNSESLITSKNVRGIHMMANKYLNEGDQEDNSRTKPSSLITGKNVRNIQQMATKCSNEEEDQGGNDQKQNLASLVTKKNVRNIHRMASDYSNAEEDQEDGSRTRSSSLINRNNINGLKKVADAYSNVEENGDETKSSSLITSKNIKNAHKIANSYSKMEDGQEDDNESSLFTRKSAIKATSYSNSGKEQEDKPQLSSLITKNNINRLQKASSYLNEDEDDDSRDIPNRPRSSPLITRENIKRVQKATSYAQEDDDKPRLPSRGNLNKTRKETMNRSDDNNFDRSSKSRGSFQDLQSIASSIIKLDKEVSPNSSKVGNRKPPPLPPRHNSTTRVITEEPLESEKGIKKSVGSRTKPPPLPPRGNHSRQDTNDSSDVERETKGRPRSTRTASYSSQLSVESPSIRRRDSSNSMKSSESTGNRFSTVDSDTIYEGIEDYPDPVRFNLVAAFLLLEKVLKDTLTVRHDLYKLRAIYVWITDNISYDCKSFYSGKLNFKASKDVLKTRMAVCAGYSELFYDLSREAGLNVCKIGGGAKGYNVGDSIGPGDYPHAWNGPTFFEEGLSFVHYFGCEIETSEDNIILDVEQTIKDGNANKIVGYLEWKGQDLDTFIQRLSKTGPKGGGENSVNLRSYRIVALCLSRYPSFIHDVNYMLGPTNRNHESQKSRNGPFTSQLEYTKKVRFEVLILNPDEDGTTPEILVIGPGFEKQSYLEPVIEKTKEFGLITLACDVTLNYKGTWNLASRNGDNSFSFLASYDVK